MRAHHFILAAALAALFLTGCGGISDPSKNQVDTFSGAVAVGGVGPVHTFNVSKNGEFTVHFTSLTPTPTAVVGTYFGQPSGGGCGIFTQGIAGLNHDPFSGQPVQKGSYCIQVYDSGGLAVAQNYTLTIAHP
jgi:hypothetical protein